MYKLLFLLVIVLIFSCSDGKQQEISSGKVVAIADGDTFTLLTYDNKQMKIRLHGIDCPEKKQDYGKVARQRLSELIFGKMVRTKKIDTDRYGRTVALVFNQSGECINEQMLREGLAWQYIKYDSNPAWRQLEEEARNKGAGLWSRPNPTPPWEWRKR